MSMSSDLGGQRVLVTGAAGQLGYYLRSQLPATGATVITTARTSAPGIEHVADLADQAAVQVLVTATSPDVIIHAAACTDVDGIEREPARGRSGNAVATRNVAEAAATHGAYLLFVSTDMVFPGDGGAPYAEHAATNPISAYGASKLAAEEAVLAASVQFGIGRTAWLYGGAGKHFPRTVLTVLRDRGAMEVVDDEIGSPTFASDLADALIRAAASRASGILHLANAGGTSRFGLAQETVRLAGLPPDIVRPTSTASFLARYPLPAARPADSRLANTRAASLGITLRPWQEALADYVPQLAVELGLNRAQ
ncbi:MAG: dTDP-4-dehydrorhamnose reductase [Thermomicrobiales bacterium]|nr:dTDP-4-dehydrorhamnose reductase [Thermomicrobiales bacterium]